MYMACHKLMSRIAHIVACLMVGGATILQCSLHVHESQCASCIMDAATITLKGGYHFG